MTDDRFRYNSTGVESPALGAYDITPSNSVDLMETVRAITIGTAAGTLSFVGRDGRTYTSGPLPLGTYPLFARRVLATGTTATGLTGWV